MKKFNMAYTLLIFLVAFNLRLGISSVPPIQNIIQENLALSNFQISLLTGIPVICMGIFAFIVGKIQRQFGMEKSIFYLLILLGVMTLGRFIPNSFTVLMISTFGIGFAIAIIAPILSGIIKKEFPEHSSILIAVYIFGMSLGSLVVSSTTKSILDKTNWNFALGIWALISLVVAFIWKMSMNDTEDKSKEETVKIKWRDIDIWKMIVFFGIQSGVFYSMAMYLVPFLDSVNISKNNLITLLTFFVAAQMIAGFVIPAAMHKIGTVKGWAIFSTICILIGVMLPIFVKINIFWAIVLIIVLSIGLGGSFPIAMLMPLDYAENPEEASRVSGIVQAFGNIFAGIIPIIFGIVVDKTGNYINLFIVMSIGAFILVLIGISKKN